MTYALFGHVFDDANRPAVRELIEQLRAAQPSATVEADAPLYDWLYAHAGAPEYVRRFDGDDFQADLCLSFGGDGTLLHTARRVGARQIPIMGLNTGHLGYLTAQGLGSPADTARMIASGAYSIDCRVMLRVSFSDDADVHGEAFALNEVAVSRQDSASMITVEARVDGTLLADYNADGLIISTPTGSTGYNLSVGGPIVAPATGVWIVSPIAAHTLSMRPLVIADSAVVTLSVSSRSGSYLMSYDGSSVVFGENVKLTLSRAPFVTRIALAPDSNFIDTLRQKLSWGS